MKCIKCENEAVYKQPFSGNPFCKDCFVESIENRIRKNINRHRMIQPKDIIAVGFSGGKDSFVLLFNLMKVLEQRGMRNNLQAIMVLEGIQDYREESEALGDKFCKENNIILHKMSFRDAMGVDLDEAIRISREKGLNSMKACTICGTARRRLLDQKAKEIGANKLAIGHNLDDQMETFLQNIIRNDVLMIGKKPVWGTEPTDIFVKKIKPLYNISEKEISLYAFYKNFPFQEHICPYSLPDQFFVLRRAVQGILNDLEESIPDVKHSLLNANMDLYEIIKKHMDSQEKSSFNVCKECGGPAGKIEELCRFCVMKKKLKEK